MSPEFEGALIQIMAQIRDELVYKNSLTMILEGYKSGFLTPKEYSKAFQIFKNEYAKAHTEQKTAR